MSTKECAAEVRALIPRVLQALHANGVWESVKSADEISFAQFEDQPRPYIVILTPKMLKASTTAAGSEGKGEKSPASVVVKFESKHPFKEDKYFKVEPRTVEIHRMLSDQGVATTLFATSLESDSSDSNQPKFTVEANGECFFNLAQAEANDKYWDTMNIATGGGGAWARLLARLHSKVPVQWFDKYRRELVELCPMMRDAADDSPLWVMLRPDALVQAHLEKKGGEISDAKEGKFLNQKNPRSPTNGDVQQIAALLLKTKPPTQSPAARVVTCHGDVWAANVVKQANNMADCRLIDLDGVMVTYAATEFAQFGCEDRAISRVYLETLQELESGVAEGVTASVTEEDVDKFWFELLIAGYVQTCILRPLCWAIAEDREEDCVADILAKTERFSAYVEKLRDDWGLALQILRNAKEKSPDMDHWISDEVMDSVLGGKSS